MDSFFITTIIISTTIFVLAMGFFAILIVMNPPQQGTYPPNSAMCPDYWKIDGSANCYRTDLDASGNCVIGDGNCINKGNIQNYIQSSSKPFGYKFTEYDKSKVTTMNFNTPYWANPCTRKKWANMYGIHWEGISNYNLC